MKTKDRKEKYIAFLRGINVGGHHKVPMAVLRDELEKMGFENIVTILNSGNIVFDAICESTEKLEKDISEHLENFFEFPIPTIIRKYDLIYDFLNADPFKEIKITKDVRLYISFLKNNKEIDLKLPWSSSDNSYKIIDKKLNNIFSVLDLSKSKTTKAMGTLEIYFGKNITTRNWNTIKRIVKK